MSTYTKVLKKFWYLFLIIVILTTSLSLVFSIFSKQEYGSTVKLLVIQQQAQGIDAYTATRSAQTVAEVLSKIVYTSSFFDKVLTSGFNISDDFGQDPEDRREEWERRVNTQLTGETGTIQVDVYSTDQKQAEQIAFGIAYVMINYGEQYHGGGDQIEIKMVDNPVTTDKPARPNIIQNTLAGFALGVLLSAVIVVLMGTRGADDKERKNKEDDMGL